MHVSQMFLGCTVERIYASQQRDQKSAAPYANSYFLMPKTAPLSRGKRNALAEGSVE
jgi:hypothetical protein